MNRFSAAPADGRPLRYWFAGLRLEADGTLLRGETPLKLPQEEAAVLRLLLNRAGEIVSPLELKRAVWVREPASSDMVAKCVASLRARLQPADCIECVYKRGYRITAVQAVDARPARAPARLVILPFANGYGVPEYLGPAIAEETAAALGSAPFAANVVARDSALTLARRGLAARGIGEALGADFVLDGVLQAMPERFRLRAEMIQAPEGVQLWIEDLTAERGRIIELESDLVNRVACRIHSGGLSISATAATTVREASPQRREAHELYLRAHHEWQSLTRHRMQDAMGRLQRAIELDPELMGARIDLTHLCVMQEIYGFMPPTVAAGQVRRAAEQIPESAENADALLPALGWVYFHVDRNMPAALDAFARSAHLEHDPWITRVRTMFLLSRHRFGEAIDLLRATIEADPFSPWLEERFAWALHLAGEREASVEQIRKAIGQFAEHDGALLYGAIILGYNGEADRAAELARALSARSAHFDLAMAVHAYALACAGRDEEARALLEQLNG
ncbi:MAG: winged helix-turn-helix domain-containing protein [Terracidiphilus sp.]|jgi:DNA-binding winged helix-turn-helix (wHTH) protein/tetratricopeptide (TPR) repeat protein